MNSIVLGVQSEGTAHVLITPCFPESSKMAKGQHPLARFGAHVRRIHLVEHESPEMASYLSSALIALVEHGTIHCGQEHLNAAREAIIPLLDLSRFEERYVLRPPWE